MAETAAAIESPVLVAIENRVKTVTINRPHRKNALDHATELAILAAVRDSCDNPDVRVTILTGAGGDFSAGADLSSGPSGKAYDVTTHLKEDVHPITLAIRSTDKPFLAKVRGSCVGVGCNFALACDMIFAGEGARFSQIFTRIGLATDGGGAYHMVRTLGWPRAYELIATGAMIPAEDAQKLGLINQVLSDADLDAAVDAMARRLADGPFVAIRQVKANLREAMDGTLASTLDAEAINQGNCFKSKDFMEGVLSFMQKRKPAYKGE